MSLLCLLHCLLKFVVVEQDPRCVIADGRSKRKIFTVLSSGWDLTKEGEFDPFSIPADEMRWWSEEEAAIIMLNNFL